MGYSGCKEIKVTKSSFNVTAARQITAAELIEHLKSVPPTARMVDWGDNLHDLTQRYKRLSLVFKESMTSYVAPSSNGEEPAPIQ